MTSRVSIPHRYSKDSYNWSWTCDMCTFQSLIGILKTKIARTRPANWFGFQSLIGILKTFQWYFTCYWTESFQSLIGILKTVSAMFQRCFHTKVSIPHRYSKDTPESSINPSSRRVSIPHRYSKDYSADDCTLRLPEFQSLIGILKTIL